MADIQSATAEIRQGKKKEEGETTGQNIMARRRRNHRAKI